jgi:hypothetical protein
MAVIPYPAGIVQIHVLNNSLQHAFGFVKQCISNLLCDVPGIVHRPPDAGGFQNKSEMIRGIPPGFAAEIGKEGDVAGLSIT